MTNLLKKWAAAWKQRQSANTVRCFDEAQKNEEAYDTIDRGTRTIPVTRIVGSVGRYRDFDDKFRLKHHVPNDRLQSIVQAMLEGKSLPPVKVYKIKDEYYVLDGHHRVSAARQLKREFVNACIIELMPSKNTFENVLYREKVAFQDRSGIDPPIELTEVGQYDQLTRQIEVHRRHLQETAGHEMPFHVAAADWHKTIHRPLCEIIRRGGLLKYFPRRTLDDLYMYISFHQWEGRQARRYGIGIDRLIPRDMEAFREKMAGTKEAEYPEMKREITAFVLMTVDGKHEHRIMARLFETDGVREVHSVHGSIDLLVKIILTRDLLASDAELVSQFVHEHVRQLPGVKSTQTLIPGYSKIKAA
jgi:hypothetical protein